MAWLNQVIQITLVNLRSLPQRVGNSLVVVTGFVGQISVIQLALAGAAGFTISHMAVNFGITFPVAALAGIAVAVVIGAAFGAVVTALVKDLITPLIAALHDHAHARRTRVLVEYVLLAGVNDSPADARLLAKLLGRETYKVNLIPYNPTGRFDGSTGMAFKRVRLRRWRRTARRSRGRRNGREPGRSRSRR